MADMKCLLVFLSLFLLIEAQRNCGRDLNGYTSGYENSLGNSVLVAGYSIFRVDIPEVCSGYTTGVRVSACDFDVAPKVLVVSQNLAYVKRRGLINDNGYVTATVYCEGGIFLSSGGNEKQSLTVHPVEESRQKQRENRRFVRAPDVSEDAIDQTRLSQSSTNRQSSKDRKTADNSRQLDNTRREAENESRRKFTKTTKSQQADQELRKALDDHIRQVAKDQARHQAAQRSENIRKSSNVQQQSSEKRTRRDVQSSDGDRQSDYNDDYFVDDITSRFGSGFRNSRINSGRQDPNVVREIFEANARQAALAQSNIQKLNEARRASQLANQNQASDIVRQALEENSRRTALAQAVREAASRSEHLSKDIQAKAIRQALEAQQRQLVAEELLLSTQDSNKVTQTNRSPKQMADNIQGEIINQIRRQSLTNEQQRTQNAAILDGRQATAIMRQLVEENARGAVDNQVLQQLDARQSYDALRQAAINQARQQSALEDRINEARRQSSIGRFRRTTKSTESSTTLDLNHDAKEEYTRQSLINASNKAQLAENKSDTRGAEEQKKIRRSLQGLNNFGQKNALQNDLLSNSLNEDRQSNYHTKQQQDDLLSKTLGADSRQEVLDKSRLEAIHEASRIAQDANARQLAQIVRESLASKKTQQNVMEQISRQAQEIIRSVQGVNAEQANSALREALAQASRQTALNQARIQELQAASRAGERLNSQQTYDAERQIQGRQNPQNARQDADAIRETLKTISRKTTSNLGRLQELQDLEARDANARQNAIEQAQRQLLNDRQQITRQDGTFKALAATARQSNDRLLQSDQRNDRRHIVESQLQAAYNSRFAHEISQL